jgi:hypothetical protein
MAEINYNNLYNQLSPMEQRYYDQQFSKNYMPGQENIMLSSQPAYEQMKAAYEAEQQIPESGFFDSIFGSASAAEPPAVPNLSYRNITPTFNLGTGITNTKAASPFKIGLSDTLNQYNVPGLQSQDLVNQLIQQNQIKANMLPSGITTVAPLQNLGFDTSFGVANEEDEEQVDYLGGQPISFRNSANLQEYFQNRNPITGIMNLLGKLPTPMNILRGGLQSLQGFNQKLRNTDFGRSKTLAEYFDRKSRAKNKKRMDAKYKEFGERDGGDRGKGMESSGVSGGVYGGGAGGLHTGE